MYKTDNKKSDIEVNFEKKLRYFFLKIKNLNESYNYYSLSLCSVLANLFKMSSLFRIFDKSLLNSMIANLENRIGNIVDLM
jgi:hypothetical protein